MIDNVDKRILSVLERDGRLSWVNLAKRVNLSPSACQRRVEALQSAGVIKNFTVQLDSYKMGQTIHAFIQIKVERQDVEKATRFRQTIASYKEVQACYKLSGNVDYLVDLTVADIRDLSHFIDNKLLALDGVVDASSAIVLEELDCLSNQIG